MNRAASTRKWKRAPESSTKWWTFIGRGRCDRKLLTKSRLFQARSLSFGRTAGSIRQITSLVLIRKCGTDWLRFHSWERLTLLLHYILSLGLVRVSLAQVTQLRPVIYFLMFRNIFMKSWHFILVVNVCQPKITYCYIFPVVLEYHYSVHVSLSN